MRGIKTFKTDVKTTIDVRHENGIFKVPAVLGEKFVFTPDPKGEFELVFYEKRRMRAFLKEHGFSFLMRENNRK
ncbi:hypothetical protein HY798_04850 [Candidatus Falkowbacteria bacterium]|nr:hypothetical protein [Candidatus Falkowbacteria bacterium]